MSTWSLEHIPAAAPESAVTKPLSEWGYVSLQLQFVNWGVDTLSITIGGATAATDDPLFGYRAQLVLWRDGVRVFRGWITGAPVQAEAAAEARTYTASGAAWWLQFYPFVWPYSPEPEVIGAEDRAAALWLGFALDCAVAGGAPIARATDSFATLLAPVPDLRASSSCAEVVARAARLHPLAAGWWDYSGATPVARSSARAGLTAQSVAIGAYGSSIQLTPRPDLVLDSVRITYRYPNPVEGQAAIEVFDDAGTTPALQGPNRLHVALDVDDSVAASEAQGFGVAALLRTALAELVWEGTLTLVEAETALPHLRPGHALSITGGRTEWESMATVVQSVTYALTPEASDTCSIALGAPEHLGPQDYFEFGRAGRLAGTGGCGNPSPFDDPTPPPPPPPPGNDLPGGSFADIVADLFGGSPTGGVEWQEAGDWLALIGRPEHDGAGDKTVPWKYFKTEAFSGSLYLPPGYYGGISSAYGFTATISGALQFADDGSTSNTGYYTPTGDISNSNVPTSPGPITDLPGVADFPTGGITTLTTKTISGWPWTGTLIGARSNEDTEDARIAYWLANLVWPGEWVSTPGVARYEARTTSRGFRYDVIRGRGRWEGCVFGWPYVVRQPTEQRAYGSGGDWTTGPTVEIAATASGTGVVETGPFVIRAERGMERRPRGAATINQY